MRFTSIPISDAVPTQAHATAALQDGTVSSRVICGDGNSIDQAVTRVERALKAQLSVDELNGAEQEAYFDELEKRMDAPSEFEDQFFAERARLGLGVGIGADGKLLTVAQALVTASLQNGTGSSEIICGNATSRAPDANIESHRVKQALKAQLSVDELSWVEQEAYFEKLEEAMWNPTQDERAAFVEAVMKPAAVGLDKNDRIVVMVKTS